MALTMRVVASYDIAHDVVTFPNGTAVDFKHGTTSHGGHIWPSREPRRAESRERSMDLNRNMSGSVGGTAVATQSVGMEKLSEVEERLGALGAVVDTLEQRLSRVLSAPMPDPPQPSKTGPEGPSPHSNVTTRLDACGKTIGAIHRQVEVIIGRVEL